MPRKEFVVGTYRSPAPPDLNPTYRAKGVVYTAGGEVRLTRIPVSENDQIGQIVIDYWYVPPKLYQRGRYTIAQWFELYRLPKDLSVSSVLKLSPGDVLRIGVGFASSRAKIVKTIGAYLFNLDLVGTGQPAFMKASFCAGYEHLKK